MPLGNAVPGLSLVLMAVGLLGRDGLAVLAGMLVGVAASFTRLAALFGD